MQISSVEFRIHYDINYRSYLADKIVLTLLSLTYTYDTFTREIDLSAHHILKEMYSTYKF